MTLKKFFELNKTKRLVIFIIFIILIFIPTLPLKSCTIGTPGGLAGSCKYTFLSASKLIPDASFYPIGITLTFILINLAISYLISSIILYFKK